MKVSIDKCSGPECPCHTIKKPLILFKGIPFEGVTHIQIDPPPPGVDAMMMNIMALAELKKQRRRR